MSSCQHRRHHKGRGRPPWPLTLAYEAAGPVGASDVAEISLTPHACQTQAEQLGQLEGTELLTEGGPAFLALQALVQDCLVEVEKHQDPCVLLSI